MNKAGEASRDEVILPRWAIGIKQVVYSSTPWICVIFSNCWRRYWYKPVFRHQRSRQMHTYITCGEHGENFCYPFAVSPTAVLKLFRAHRVCRRRAFSPLVGLLPGSTREDTYSVAPTPPRRGRGDRLCECVTAAWGGEVTCISRGVSAWSVASAARRRSARCRASSVLHGRFWDIQRQDAELHCRWYQNCCKSSRIIKKFPLPPRFYS